MKFRLPVMIAAALFLASVPAAQAVATGGPPTATIGPYHFHSDTFEIFSKEATDVVTVPVMIAPSHSNGWHVHPGPAFVIVTAGTLTLYRATDSGCDRSTYGPGQGFVEAPGLVHIARNEGTTLVTGFATILNVPAATGAFRTNVAPPDNCTGIS